VRTLGRRALLQLGAALAGASALAARASAQSAPRPLAWRNWGGNLECRPARIVAPSSEDELLALLRGDSTALRAVGTGHSWTPLVPTEGTLVTVDRMSGLIAHDAATLTADAWAGTKLFALGPLLEAIGQSLQNMSDINYQSLGGALATSTHGTGRKLGSLSSFVTGLRLATPSGELLDCDAQNNPEVFHAARCSLGALGVVTRVRLQNRASHRLRQQQRLGDIDEILERIDELADANEQFELFPLTGSRRTVVVTTNEAPAGMADFLEDDPNALLELRRLFGYARWIPPLSQFLYNQSLDLVLGDRVDERVGPAHAVLAHPRTIRFIEMEYTVPAAAGPDCLREVLATIEQKAPEVCFPLEYRYVRGDDTLIGMFSGPRDGASISVHQFAEDPHWQEYLGAIEPVFWKYEGRPHWGKWHSLDDTRLGALYPQWQRFKEIRATLDPAGRLLNAHLRTLFGLA
jgi:FAD-linked oxidoreductase